MTLHTFRPEFVYYQPVDNHETHKNFILDAIKDEVDFRRINRSNYAEGEDPSNAVTNFFKSFSPDRPNNTAAGTTQINYPNDLLHDVFNVPFSNLYKEINLTNPIPTSTVIKEIWWNYYFPGRYTEPHIHLDSDFSLIYIVKLEEENKTRFFRNGRSGRFPLFEEYYDTNHIEEGNVIIFPSSMLHWVQPVAKERCTLIANVLTEYEFTDWPKA
jgi:hypothetical protein